MGSRAFHPGIASSFAIACDNADTNDEAQLELEVVSSSVLPRLVARVSSVDCGGSEEATSWQGVEQERRAIRSACRFRCRVAKPMELCSGCKTPPSGRIRAGRPHADGLAAARLSRAPRTRADLKQTGQSISGLALRRTCQARDGLIDEWTVPA